MVSIMRGVNIKTELKHVFCGILMSLFLFAAPIMTYAADMQTEDINTTKFYKITDRAFIEGGIKDMILSMFSPNEACAAAVLLSCKDYCKEWRILDTCCVKVTAWKKSTPSKCKTIWTCPG